MMNIECAPVFFGCFPTNAAQPIPHADLALYLSPIGAVAEYTAPAPSWVTRARAEVGVVVSGRAALAAELVPVPLRVHGYQTDGATSNTDDFLARNSLAPEVVTAPAAPESAPGWDFASGSSTFHISKRSDRL